MDWLTFIIIGLVAGWLAGIITRAHGLGCLTDIVVGMIGAVIGGYLLSLIGIIPDSFLGWVGASTVGAALLLLLLNAISGKAPGGRR
ncbi:MAG: GlsB/YeaQ/YmgE family stress response membrane protein [Thermoleophilia bacterium]